MEFIKGFFHAIYNLVCSASSTPFLLSSVYGKNDPRAQSFLWTTMRQIPYNINSPWWSWVTSPTFFIVLRKQVAMLCPYPNYKTSMIMCMAIVCLTYLVMRFSLLGLIREHITLFKLKLIGSFIISLWIESFLESFYKIDPLFHRIIHLLLHLTSNSLHISSNSYLKYFWPNMILIQRWLRNLGNYFFMGIFYLFSQRN